MEGHPGPRADGPPQAQPQPPHDVVSPSQYSTLPEVALNSPDSAAPQVVYYSAPETVPPHHYNSHQQHATSDVSPTSLGQGYDGKQLASPSLGQAPEDKHLAYTEYESMSPSPPGHEPSPEMAEELAMKKHKKRRIWILAAIAILLVIAAAVGGGVGGTMAARNRAAQEASQLSSNTQPTTSSTSQPGTTSTSQPSTSSTSRPSSTSSGVVAPSSVPAGNGTRTGGAPGEVCIEGTGEGNFSGLCSFACHYGYVPAPCTCKAWGAQIQPPPSTGQKGYPRVDVPDRCSYLGLCSFAWDRGYTDNLAACSPEPAGGVGCT
ncbi:hypothetical protein MAPG_08821 [Magnaporthiopsis poae ATCC 64411]|uniref:Uncharacterized protein n=1 Tax=Magnaporthiopsis poae (strain ATCC 64411 / 73-15) TaxID=644358 RepID=A0A0C4E8C1_MAGP6|nr:hypothetical protein MAPG_08821 [Magnaporthiopsis poae ATCC 64411]